MADDLFFRDEDEGEEGARRARPKRRLRDRWLFLALVGIVVVVLLAGAAVTGYYGQAAKDALDSINRDPTLMPTSTNRPEPVPPKEGESNRPLNFVLMGSDSRGSSERGRSDVLILLHIPSNRKEAYLVSLPRDYWVPIPDHGAAKINAAYAYGGPALTVQTVEQLLDVPIDHTALIDFDGFVGVIDALRGVTVNNRYASSSGRFTYPKGKVELTGDSALNFVRERKNLPAGDFSRAERQRDVLKAIISKLISRGVLTNPSMFRESVTTLGPNFTVDEALDNGEIVDIGLDMRLKGGNDIKSLLAPIAGVGTSADGQSIVNVDKTKLAQLSRALRSDTMGEYYAANR